MPDGEAGGSESRHTGVRGVCVCVCVLRVLSVHAQGNHSCIHNRRKQAGTLHGLSSCSVETEWVSSFFFSGSV